MNLTFDYAGMDGVELAAWIILATLAGVVARQIARGTPMGGLFGDMVIGLIGVFAVGWVMRRLGVDLSQSILTAAPGVATRAAIWLDVFVVAFVGAMLIRFVLRLAGR